MKIIQKVDLGMGFNALLLAVAGGLTVLAIEELYDFTEKIKNREALRKCRDNIDFLSKFVEAAKRAEEREQKGEEEAQ